MHVAAKIGLAVAGGVTAGVLMQRASGRTSDAPVGATIAMGGLAGSATGLGAKLLVSGRYPSTPLLFTITAGSMGMGIALSALFGGSGPSAATHGVRELPIPSPEPGPSPVAPEPGPAPAIGDPLRPDEAGSGPVEAEVETYGPDGEWLGTEHGTLGG